MKKITLIIFSIVLLMTSCQKIKIDNNSNLPIMELGPNTKIIDSLTALTIQSIDSNHIVFNGNTIQLQSLATGNIIVSGIAINAPTGFLRRITDIQKSGSVYNITTTEATLTEAFGSLHIDTETGPVTFTIAAPGKILFDDDGNNNTTFDQLKVDVNLDIKPKLHVKIDIDDFKLGYAKLEGNVVSTLNTVVQAGGSIGNVSAKLEIYTPHPVAIVTIPGTPIVIAVYLRVSVGADGSINAYISASDKKTKNINAYMEYTNSQWGVGYTKTLENQFAFFDLNGGASAKVYVEPAIDFKLWGSNWARGSISVQGYLTATGQIIPTRSCELKAGINASAEANLKFFGWTFGATYYPSIFDYSQILYTCSSLSITSSPITNITITSAVSGGNVTNAGNSSVTSRGVCWSTNHNPTIANTKTINGSGIGVFTSNLTGLIPNTNYYLRAYAINSTDTAYGNEISFATQPNVASCGTITDIDGNTYNSVTIGTQCWTKENLNTIRYRNGDIIPQVTDSAQWANLTTGAWCYYNNDASTAITYGRFYNRAALLDSRGLAPTGWHVPTSNEFVILTTYLGGTSVAGAKLKEIGTSHWLAPNTEATNSSGFTALASGARRIIQNITPPYGLVDFGGMYYTGQFMATNGGIQVFANSSSTGGGGSSNAGGSVRCIKD